MLTYNIIGKLGDFASGGALHVHNHQLNQSRMRMSGLAGKLTATWSLSASLPHPIQGLLDLDVKLPLFRWPLLFGDFPIYLSVEAELHLAPVFGLSAQVLRSQAVVQFSGSQGFTFAEQVHGPTRSASAAPDRHLHPNANQPWLRGQAFALPHTLDLAATFPYLEIGDDINNPLTGALVWTGLSLDTQTGAGTSQVPCLRVDAGLHGDAGVTAWLFGLHAGASWRLFTEPIGSASLPTSPACV